MTELGQDPQLQEVCIESAQAWRGELLNVRRDLVRLPNGREATREYIVHPGAAVIVPLLDDGCLVMERQFRYPLGQVMLEFPAGKIDPGESTLTTAMRELAEETGYSASEWARAGVLHNAVAYSNEAIEVWFARGLVAGEQRLEHGELLEVVTIHPDDLERSAGRGEITDAKTLIGLLWLRNWQAGRWSLQWMPAPQSGG